MKPRKESGTEAIVDFFKKGAISPYYRLFFKNINALIYVHDIRGRIVYLNKFAERISQYKVEELIGRHFKNIVAPESLPVAYKAFHTQLSGKNVKPFELAVLDKNGERIHLKTTETVILNNRGKVAGVLGIATDITEHKELTQKLSKMVKELNILHEISRELSSILDIDLLLYRIVKHLNETLGYERASVGLIDSQKDELVIRTAEPPYPKAVMAKLRLKIGEGITGYVAKTGKPYICNDVKKDPHYVSFDQNTKSEMAVPLKIGDKIVGVINIESYHKDTFDEEDIQTLTLIANQAAIAVENSRLYSSLKQTYLESIKTLVSAIEAKDHYTYGHSERVRRYALQIARVLKLSPQQIEELNYAGYLHDIGKIGINDRILTKPDKLSPSEYEIIKRHPNIGHKILESAHHLAGASQIIKYEHERYDGTGYPNGLKNGEIPIGARIIAVADAYDAMTTNRPYRKALSREEAIRRLKENMGTQFDPKVVRAFLKIIKRK